MIKSFRFKQKNTEKKRIAQFFLLLSSDIITLKLSKASFNSSLVCLVLSSLSDLLQLALCLPPALSLSLLLSLSLSLALSLSQLKLSFSSETKRKLFEKLHHIHFRLQKSIEIIILIYSEVKQKAALKVTKKKVVM